MNLLFRHIMLCLMFFVVTCSCETHQNSTNRLPEDSDKISTAISDVTGNGYAYWDLLGYQKGEKLPDFTLRNINGDRFNLYETLKLGKPVMLITGSTTCDHTRKNLNSINAFTNKYSNKLSIYIIYTQEAHPCDAISPYSLNHEIWESKANIRDHVKASQPRTYGERKALASKWQKTYKVQPTVLIDNPGNDSWKTLGQAPNMMYLIEPDGNVYYKQVWAQMEEVEGVATELVK